MRLLLVEDDELLGDAVNAGLTQDGHAVTWVRDGVSAEAACRSDAFDLVVLDLGLPRRSGLEVLTATRKRGSLVPVLILTARDTVADRVQGLDTGADDYLTKPFELDELCARVRALGRRVSGRATPLLVHGTLTLDPAAHAVTREGRSVKVSRQGFVILRCLLENAGRLLSRDRLEQELYGWDQEIGSNAVEVHIHHLRKRLGRELIRTVRGVGYLIDKPDRNAP